MRFASVKYDVNEDANDLDVIATVNGLRVGRALCLKNDTSLKLADIEVDIPHRNRGIGSELLRIVLEKADAAGINEIWGIITEKDLKETPHLLDWYVNNGFIALDPDAGTDPRLNAVKKIVRRR